MLPLRVISYKFQNGDSRSNTSVIVLVIKVEPSRQRLIGKTELLGKRGMGGGEVKIGMENGLKDDQMFLISQAEDSKGLFWIGHFFGEQSHDIRILID